MIRPVTRFGQNSAALWARWAQYAQNLQDASYVRPKDVATDVRSKGAPQTKEQQSKQNYWDVNQFWQDDQASKIRQFLSIGYPGALLLGCIGATFNGKKMPVYSMLEIMKQNQIALQRTERELAEPFMFTAQ